MENKEKETFKFTYSAKEQEEIRTIRKKYVEPEITEDKMACLRRLDAAVTQKATCASLVLGILGALVLGTGMSLVMTDIGALIGLADGIAMLVGIVLGTVGLALVCAAYPVYNSVIGKERKKIAPEIIRLTDELMR